LNSLQVVSHLHFEPPARAIEFIAIDFVITNSGAAFED